MRNIRTIMLIDDDPINNLICRETIRHFDESIRVLEYENPHNALGFLSLQSKNRSQALPDIIFLDINMPIMDGWMFLEEYKKLLPHFNFDIELFLLSSSTNSGDFKRAKNFPVVSYYIHKPLTLEVLEKIKNDQVPNV